MCVVLAKTSILNLGPYIHDLRHRAPSVIRTAAQHAGMDKNCDLRVTGAPNRQEYQKSRYDHLPAMNQIAAEILMYCRNRCVTILHASP